ncbi:MAG: hypothetical protein Q4G04_02310 [bacterium]|nr:hypothetical protein [bacterium]
MEKFSIATRGGCSVLVLERKQNQCIICAVFYAGNNDIIAFTKNDIVNNVYQELSSKYSNCDILIVFKENPTIYGDGINDVKNVANDLHKQLLSYNQLNVSMIEIGCYKTDASDFKTALEKALQPTVEQINTSPVIPGFVGGNQPVTPSVDETSKLSALPPKEIGVVPVGRDVREINSSVVVQPVVETVTPQTQAMNQDSSTAGGVGKSRTLSPHGGSKGGNISYYMLTFITIILTIAMIYLLIKS